jgi:hypothetical protein
VATTKKAKTRSGGTSKNKASRAARRKSPVRAGKAVTATRARSNVTHLRVVGSTQCGRFDYIQYNPATLSKQLKLKAGFIELETMINQNISSERARVNALEALENSYMWIGKGLRDDQILSTGEVPLQEQRQVG